MGKHRNPYAPEFRAQIVEPVKSGRTPEDLAREFEPTAPTIYNWVAQSDRDAGKPICGPVVHAGCSIYTH